MCEKKRIVVGWLPSSLYGHFSLWAHSLRTILMAVFILLLAFMSAKSQAQTIEVYRMGEVHLGEILYVYANSGFNLIMTTVGFLVMMSEIPKRVSYQNYTLMRMSRGKWLASLVIFCVCAVLVFELFLAAFSVLFSLPFLAPGDGWSDLERLAADPNYIYEVQLVPEYIRGISPSMACVMAMVVLYFFWVTLALLILLFSIVGIPNFGVVLCVSLVMANITILFESLPSLGAVLPTRFATLGAITGQVQEHKLRHTLLIMGGYVMVDMFFIALMFARIQHMDIQFSGKD